MIKAPPASEEWITMRVKVCLSHFYAPDEEDHIAGMAMRSWHKVLGGLPGPLVAFAFDEWEETKTHRPAPSHIAGIARKRWRDNAEWISRVEVRHEDYPYAPVELTQAELQRRAEIARMMDRSLNGSRQDQVRDILAITEEETGVTAHDILSDRRAAEICRARFFAVYACQSLVAWSYPVIGKLFGDRDHTTIMNAVSRAKEMINSSEEDALTFSRIKERSAKRLGL